MLRRLPPVDGLPIRISWQPDLRSSRGKLISGPGPGTEVHAGSFLRERVMVLDSALKHKVRERRRILIHELFHFVWLRLGNFLRRSWESQLLGEWRLRARGELGWSAEFRKRQLSRQDADRRSRHWREYACESFCDTAAYVFAGLTQHGEFTLAQRHRKARRSHFRALFESQLTLRV